MATIDSTTPYTWQDYEEAVFQECERVYHFHNAEIVKNAHIEGRYSGVNRQIDVLVRLCEGGKVISTIPMRNRIMGEWARGISALILK